MARVPAAVPARSMSAGITMSTRLRLAGYGTYIDKEKALNYLHHSVLLTVTSDKARLNSAAKVVKDFENPSVSENPNLDRPTAKDSR